MNKIKYITIAIFSCAILFFAVKFYYGKKIKELTNIILSAENTIKIKDGIVIKKTVELQNLKNNLDSSNEQISKLIFAANKLKADLIYANQLNVIIKDLEGKLKAVQSTDQKHPGRKIVEFSGNLKNFNVDGWTKTDPPESFIKINQIKPIKLSVGILKNKSNIYSTVVTSEDDVEIDVNTATIDLKMNEHWYNKIYISANVGFYDNANSIGLSYKFNDRIIIGAMCTVSNMKNCSMSTMYKVIR